MTIKQLQTIKLHIISVKNKMELQQYVDYSKYGKLMYINTIIENILDNYISFKNIINKYHLKITPLSQYDESFEEIGDVDNYIYDYIISSFNMNDNFNMLLINKKLPQLFIDYVHNFHEEKTNHDKEILEFFKNLPKYKIINNNVIKINNEELEEFNLEQQLFYFNISYDILNWSEFVSNIFNLSKEKKYKDLLSLIDN